MGMVTHVQLRFSFDKTRENYCVIRFPKLEHCHLDTIPLGIVPMVRKWDLDLPEVALARKATVGKKACVKMGSAKLVCGENAYHGQGEIHCATVLTQLSLSQCRLADDCTSGFMNLNRTETVVEDGL